MTNHPRTYLCIFNTTAGSFSRWEAQRIKEILNAEPRLLKGEVFATRSQKDLENLLKEYADFHPDILGIGGGDGTASQTLTSVYNIWNYLPEIIAPFSMGTVNQWAAPADLNDGLVDKAKKIVHWPSTKPIQLAKYLLRCAKKEEQPRTQPLDLLDINGKKGFNTGFGAVPKVLWIYYGKTPEQYHRLEEDLRNSPSQDYTRELNRIWNERTLIDILSNGTGGLLKRSGAVYAFSAAAYSMTSILDPDRREFFQGPFEGELELDGKKIESERLVNAVYVSTYPGVNLGIKWVNLLPAPEAGKEPGKMQIVLCTDSLFGVINQLPRLFTGEHLENMQYHSAAELKLRSELPLIGHIEADFVMGKEFTIRYDRTLRVVAPFGRKG